MRTTKRAWPWRSRSWNRFIRAERCVTKIHISNFPYMILHKIFKRHRTCIHYVACVLQYHLEIIHNIHKYTVYGISTRDTTKIHQTWAAWGCPADIKWPRSWWGYDGDTLQNLEATHDYIVLYNMNIIWPNDYINNGRIQYMHVNATHPFDSKQATLAQV